MLSAQQPHFRGCFDNNCSGTVCREIFRFVSILNKRVIITKNKRISILNVLQEYLIGAANFTGVVQ